MSKKQVVPAVGVLDFSESASLLWLAARDGLVDYVGTPQHREEVLEILRAERAKRSALDAIILFNELSLSSVEDWDLSILSDIVPIAVERPPESDIREKTREGAWLTPTQLQVARLIKKALMPFLNRKYKISSTEFDRFVRAMEDPDIGRRVTAGQGIIAWPSGFELHVMEAIHVIERAARSTGAVISSRLRARPITADHAGSTVYAGESTRDYRRAFAIVCSEVDCLPLPRNLDEALNMRRDMRIVDFREALWRWASALRDSDLAAEAALRRDVRKAHQAMKTVSRIRPIGRLVTCASIPLAFVPSLGLPLTALGAAIECTSAALEWRHRWLSFYY